MSGIPLGLLFILTTLLIGCAQQEYMRGYNAGMDRQDEFCKASKKIDDIACQYDLTDLRANLKMCNGILEAYKAGHK